MTACINVVCTLVAHCNEKCYNIQSNQLNVVNIEVSDSGER